MHSSEMATSRTDRGRGHWGAALLALGASTLLATACSSGTPASSGTGPAQHTTSAPTTGSSAGAGGGAGGFLAKLQAGTHATFVATYRLAVGSQPSETLTIAASGSDSLFEVHSAGGAFEEISTSSLSVFCTQGSGQPWTCLSGGASSSIGAGAAALAHVYAPGYLMGTVQAAIAAAGTNGAVTASSRTINGMSMSCLTMRETAASITGTYCVTGQGVLGYTSTTGPEPTSLTLLSFSSSVSAGEFTPPAAPQSLPSS